MSIREKLLSYFASRDRGWILSLFAAVCLLYLPYLGSPFIFDDLSFFKSGLVSHYAHVWFNFDLRWLPYASLSWTALLFSDAAPHLFHLGNLLLHIANVILLFYLLRQLVLAAIPESHNSSVVDWGAWLGAMIFVLHPVAVYAVDYVVQRSILLATLFALLMLLAYLRGLLTGQGRWLALAVAAYFMAVFAKEHSVMMAAVAAAMTVVFRAQISANKRALWMTWGAFAAIGLLIIMRAKGVFGIPYEPMAAALFEQQDITGSTLILHMQSVLTQAGLFFKYLLLWLLPNPAWMSVDMREPFVARLAAWHGWLGFAGFLLYGYIGIKLLFYRGAKGLLGLALLYPWLQFWLEFASIRVQEPFVLYRSYLWMPGMLLLLPLMLVRWPGRKILYGIGLVLLLLTAAALNRLWVFDDSYRLWNDAALLLPNERVAGADRIYFNRGQAEAGLQKWNEAAEDFQRVETLSPQLAAVRYELGTAYLNLSLFQKALEQFDAGIAINPEESRQYYGKSLALMRLHERVQSLQQMNKACQLGERMACMMAGLLHSKK